MMLIDIYLFNVFFAIL